VPVDLGLGRPRSLASESEVYPSTCVSVAAHLLALSDGAPVPIDKLKFFCHIGSTG